MEEYVVSARKYRPASFDSVVGQNALTTTLKNAIASGKLAHAYLFCGPRGVGKTTCARIFAKTINCLHPLPDHEACNQCESCVAFNEQRSLNIHELDAASNNSVEDIRQLIEQVHIPPQVGKYKVFIIDEVHMLSTAAFNAFLKTLEEPPAHVIFILATTEKQKLLPTILSRCQIFDFNRMSPQDTVNHLKFVAEKEGITYEPEALNIIAQKADGGMRDALSIFDQVASYTQGNITYQKTIENLNVLDYEYYFRLTDHILNHEVAPCLLLFNEILEHGFEGGHFISGLAAHFRDLLVSKEPSTLPLLEVSGNVRTRYQEQAKKCDSKFLYRAIKLCNDCDLNYKASKNRRLLVEITLIQLTQLTPDDDSGSGRRPEHQLKPIFNTAATQLQAGSQTNQTQANRNTRPSTAGSAPLEKSTPLKTDSLQEEPAANHYTTDRHRNPLPVQEETNAQIPTVKKGFFGPSIRKTLVEGTEEKTQTDNKASFADTTPHADSKRTANSEEDFIVTEKDICFYWHEFANLLPQEETAMAKRMKIIQPKLLHDETFEVVVDNEQVKAYMQQMAPRIQSHMRRQLHNSKITMEVRVAENHEKARIYSKPELFVAMAKKNPNLLKLKEAFGLELT